MKQVSCLTILAVIITLSSVQTAPPWFESTYETKVVVEGSKAWILCSATNDLSITYRWYNDYGDELTSDVTSDVHVSGIKEGTSLIFEKVDTSQEGTYTCTAENQHGLVSKLFEIIVNSDNLTGNGTLYVEEVHVLNASDTSVEFLVRASMPFENYTMTVKYFEKLNRRKTVKRFSKDENLVLDGLIPSGLYTFQFQAISPAEGSISYWSDPLEVILLPYTPELVLRSLTGNALQIQWSKKSMDSGRGTIDGYLLSYASIRRASFDVWDPKSCFINIQLPHSCFAPHFLLQYTIAALNGYYEIRLKAHTKAGYGKPFVTRVFVA